MDSAHISALILSPLVANFCNCGQIFPCIFRPDISIHHWALDQSYIQMLQGFTLI